MKDPQTAASPPSAQGGTALLVIDVQQGLFETPTPIYKAEQLLRNITTLVGRAHRSQVPVIYVQHSGGETLVRDTPPWQLHPRLQPLEGETILHKQHPNAFEDTPLHAKLQAGGITHLVIAGLVTHGCVRATCLGALKLGYHLTLVEDAHSSFNKKAPALISELNRKIASMKGTVIPAAEVSFS